MSVAPTGNASDTIIRSVWYGVSDLQDRGLEDTLIAYTDNLRGLLKKYTTPKPMYRAVLSIRSTTHLVYRQQGLERVNAGPKVYLC